MNNFHIKEFIDEPEYQKCISPQIAEIMCFHHMKVIQKVRDSIGEPIFVQSGYRSYEHELKNNRSGNSQHVFKGLGAVDYTAENILLLGYFLLETPYKRICYYPHNKFYHCDYVGEKRQLYMCKNQKDWIKVDKWP